MTPSSKRQPLELQQVQQLPKFLSMAIPPDYLDVYQHMNVQYYAKLWGKGAGGLLKHLGIQEAFRAETGTGHWLLSQLINYLAEIRVNETISIHGRIVDRSEKRMHNMYWMVNETTSRIAATSEVVVANADLELRRMAPFSDQIKAAIDAHLEEMKALGWEVPVSGALHS